MVYLLIFQLLFKMNTFFMLFVLYILYGIYIYMVYSVLYYNCAVDILFECYTTLCSQFLGFTAICMVHIVWCIYMVYSIMIVRLCWFYCNVYGT